MRGNWDQAEPLVLAAEQHQQLQHQHQPTSQSLVPHTIVHDTDSQQPGVVGHHHLHHHSLQQHHHHQQQQHLHPLHSQHSPPATPAWSSITVKEEPQEDKNNDSGISPGHYTSDSASPHSRHSSSSTANCSLSPGSASSPDSNNMQINGFEYSPQRMYKSCESPLDYARLSHHVPMDESTDLSMVNHHHMLTSDVVSSSSARSNDQDDAETIEVSPDPLQCPICNFSTQSRLQFTEHLASHCNTTSKCDTEFTKSVMEQLTNGGSIGSPEEMSRASPTQMDRNSEHESEEADEPGLRVPRVNSQGKVKTFRCKQCNFVAITKLDFWEHSRSHIKKEKLLTCPKCPFVTEYKHHLEYHLRNHFGSKPYKCDKCSYSCVNKSMLNSHLKSHSNVYQFRCADCSYATKYCHSLKLHLRKYEHKPAMVLNADGSPNPLPIIDVYGTRRGPKTKPKKDSESQSHAANGLVNNIMPTVVPQQNSPLGHQFQFNPMNGINGMPKINGFNGFNGTASPSGLGLPAAAPGLIGFPYGQLFGGFPIPNPFSIGSSNEDSNEKQMENLKVKFMEYAKKMSNGESKLPEDVSPANFSQTINGMLIDTEIARESASPYDNDSDALSPAPEKRDESEPTESKAAAPLDLSKPELTSNDESMRLEQSPSANSPKTSGTSRRKGRAVRLDRRVMMSNDSDEEHAKQQPEEIQQAIDIPAPSTSPGSTDSKDSKDTTHFSGPLGMSSEFTCQYCEISFGNEVMHSVHMGYHGYQNPYTCNMCGIQCTDKVSFFLHIARVKH